MKALKNHPTMWLREDAADAFDAAEAKYGVFKVNRAGVTVADQQVLIDRWHKGGVYNRPPYLYQPAEPATSSNHVKAIAVDLADWERFKSIAGEFGFAWQGSSDVVHFNFVGKPQPNVVFSQQVQDQQNWLRAARGEDIQADGKLGPLTKAAFTRYQHFLHDFLYGYNAGFDGVWGPGTQTAHAAYYSEFNAARPNAKRGDKGQYVKDIQARLGVLGHPVTVDGDFGPNTDAAVRAVQSGHNLVRDGIVGIRTRRVLGL